MSLTYRRGLKVIASDINHNFLEGTKANIAYAIKHGYLHESVLSRTEYLNADATLESNWNYKYNVKGVNCVYINFPWGENILRYHNDVQMILLNLLKHAASGTMCCFISKQSILEEFQESSHIYSTFIQRWNLLNNLEIVSGSQSNFIAFARIE